MGTKDLQYISNHYNEMRANLNRISEGIMNVMPKVRDAVGTPVNGSKLLRTVKFSKLENWDVARTDGRSGMLIQLAEKLVYMINKGDSHNIEPMLKRIIYKGEKRFQIPTGYTSDDRFPNRDTVGRGHFRRSRVTFNLTELEINRIKEYFKL